MGFLASTAPALPSVDWTASIDAAAAEGLGILQDNVLYLFALPVAWVGYKIVRKVIAKVG